MKFSDRLDALRDWFDRHGSSIYADADEWINSMTNVELLDVLSWFDDND